MVTAVNDNNVFHHQTSLQFKHAGSGLRQRKIKLEIRCLQPILSPHIRRTQLFQLQIHLPSMHSQRAVTKSEGLTWGILLNSLMPAHKEQWVV